MLVFRGITRLADQLCVDIHLLLIEFFWKLDDAKGLVIEINMIEKAIKMFNELRMTTIMSKHSRIWSTIVLLFLVFLVYSWPFITDYYSTQIFLASFEAVIYYMKG